VYCAGRDQVSDSWIAGRHVLADREAVTFDQHEILKRVDAWQHRVSAAR
jgi:5-methylthioadenosine/S-adenosylhomocysteine deaminase